MVRAEFRWLLDSVVAGLRDSRDYAVAARTNMPKVVAAMADTGHMDRLLFP